jgi:cytochrome c-type biogenesis protein CcmH/NrfF
MSPGQELKLGHFTFRHDALRVTKDAQKEMHTGLVSVFEDGKPIGTMEPARWFFFKHEDQPTTEVAIRRAPAEDVYIVLATYDAATQQATYAVTINPLVNWIWFGFGVMAIGTILALLPESAFAFAAARLPAGAGAPATTTVSLLILCLLLPASAHAQANQSVRPVARTELERRLESDVLCTCGCRRPVATCGMPNCDGEKSQRAKIRQYVNEGKDRDAVIAAFVQEFGGEDILAAPIDRGFNRLAWLFPYLVGLCGAAGVWLAAVKWARRGHADGDDPMLATAGRSDLSARLDDELRDLD